MLGEPGADKAREVLELVEGNRLIGYVTPLVLEEVTFKVMIAQASSILGEKSLWKIREALKYERHVREQCSAFVNKVQQYIRHLCERGLRVASIEYEDWENSLRHVDKYGLLPADAINLSVALRMKIGNVATFDEDFRTVKEINVLP